MKQIGIGDKVYVGKEEELLVLEDVKLKEDKLNKGLKIDREELK